MTIGSEENRTAAFLQRAINLSALDNQFTVNCLVYTLAMYYWWFLFSSIVDLWSSTVLQINLTISRLVSRFSCQLHLFIEIPSQCHTVCPLLLCPSLKPLPPPISSPSHSTTGNRFLLTSHLTSFNFFGSQWVRWTCGRWLNRSASPAWISSAARSSWVPRDSMRSSSHSSPRLCVAALSASRTGVCVLCIVLHSTLVVSE